MGNYKEFLRGLIRTNIIFIESMGELKPIMFKTLTISCPNKTDQGSQYSVMMQPIGTLP